MYSFPPKNNKIININCSTNLQEANSHEEETVGTNSTCKNLIKVSLQ